MKFRRALAATALLFLAPVWASHAQESNQKPITNTDVISLMQAELGEQVVLAAIEHAPARAFDTSADALIALKEAGASDAVLAAVLRASAASATPGAVAAPASRPEAAAPAPASDVRRPPPGIYIEQITNGQTDLVPLEPTVISRVRTGGVWASRFTAGIAKTEIVAEIRGWRAPLRTSVQQPTFYFYFDDRAGGFGGGGGQFVGWLAAASSPNEFALVQMYEEDDRRELSLGKGNIGGASSGLESENVVPLKIERLAPGAYRVTPDEVLGEGEFCFFYAAGAGTLAEGNTVAKLFDFGVD